MNINFSFPNTITEAKNFDHLNDDPDAEALKQHLCPWINKSFTLQDLPALITAIQSTDCLQMHFGAIGIRKILSEGEPLSIQSIIDANLIPKLIEFVRNDAEPHLQLEAAWCLTNIVSGTSEQTNCVVREEAIPLFVKLLESPHAAIVENAMWALGNIAGDCVEYRDEMLKCDVTKPLTQRIANAKYFHILKTGVWLLSNLCRQQPPPNDQYVFEFILTVSWVLPTTNDFEIIEDCVWALYQLSENSIRGSKKVVEIGIAPRLIQLLSHPYTRILVPTLRTLRSLTRGGNYEIDQLIKFGIINKLHILLSHDKKPVRREACAILSNITAGNNEQIEQVLIPEILNKVFALALTDSLDVSKEATRIVCNGTVNGTPEQMKYFINEGLLILFNTLLGLEANEERNLMILEASFNLLSIGQEKLGSSSDSNPVLTEMMSMDFVGKIEAMQSHPNEEVYQKATKILDKYFDIETTNEHE